MSVRVGACHEDDVVALPCLYIESGLACLGLASLILSSYIESRSAMSWRDKKRQKKERGERGEGRNRGRVRSPLTFSRSLRRDDDFLLLFSLFYFLFYFFSFLSLPHGTHIPPPRSLEESRARFLSPTAVGALSPGLTPTFSFFLSFSLTHPSLFPCLPSTSFSYYTQHNKPHTYIALSAYACAFSVLSSLSP